MITLYRGAERSETGPQQEVWPTPFGADGTQGPGGVPPLALEESRLPPGTVLPPQRRQPAELVTYLREGALAYEESTGSSGVLQAGEFQRTTAGHSLLRHEENASPTHAAHLLRLCLPPLSLWCSPSHETKRFSAAQRRGLLCVVASPDGRHGSLRLHQEILVHSALLEPGQHLVHQLDPGRRAWLHLVAGQITLADALLDGGDGAGIEAERAVSLRAHAPAEILLVDLA